MATIKTVLITGAAGNLGAKLRHHLRDGYCLRLLDVDPRGDPAVHRADLAEWDAAWVGQFHGADAVVHLAGDPAAHQTWPNLVGPNLDALVNVFLAAARVGVKRVVYASSNHVMGGYKAEKEWPLLTTALPPRPGTRYQVQGEARDSSPYGATKLFGERLGKCFAESYGLSVVAVRIGWVWRGENRPEDLPDREPWFRLMWLSNRDFCQVMECCLRAPPSLRFTVVNAMSANPGMPWDLAHTTKMLGYAPQDGMPRANKHGERPA